MKLQMTSQSRVLTPAVLLGTIISATIVLTASADLTNCTPPPAGLVCWWRAETNALDEVGGHNGTPYNGVGFAPGEAGQAFVFNGTNSYVEVPDSPALRLTNELTIEFWVKRQDLGMNDYIVNKGGDWTRGGLNYGVSIARSQYGSHHGFQFAGGSRDSISIADLNWHHIAVVARNGDVDPTFYVDGVPQPVTARAGASTINLYPSTEPLRIGAQVDPASGWSYYSKAIIDELSLYSRALAAAEIQAIYNAGSAGKCQPVPPSILTQPRSQTVAAGASVSLCVEAAGTPPLSYQWRHFSTNLPSATNVVLALSNIKLNDAGDYRVVITNSAGSITSAAAMLSLAASPVINSLSFNSSTYRLTVPTEVGPTYVVEYKDDLEDPSWRVLTTIVGTGLPIPITDNGLTNTARFYRVRVQ